MNNLEKLKDEDLITLILHHDATSLGELYARYNGKVFHKCISFVHNYDEAFDLSQDIMLKAFDNLKNFRGESSFSTWLYVITHRYCLEAMRKKQRSAIDSYEEWTMDNYRDFENSEDPCYNNEREKIMLELINKLPANEKELVFLKYLKGASIRMLQLKFGLSSSAVKMRLKRIRDKLTTSYNKMAA